MEASGSFCRKRPPLSCSIQSYSQLLTSTWPDHKGAHSPRCFGKYRRYVMRRRTARRHIDVNTQLLSATATRCCHPATSSTAIRPTRPREKMSPDLIQQHLQFGGEEQDCFAHPSIASAGPSDPAGRNRWRNFHRGDHLSMVVEIPCRSETRGRRSSAA
jgi:hypothetical protein